jgi:polysaccharide export outer membrane protein
MGFVKRAVVSIAALGLGALLVANWRSHGETQRKLDALVGALTGRPADPTPSAPATQAPAEPGLLPPSVVVPAGGTAPRDLDKSTTPAHVIEPPDVLVVDVVLRDPRTGQTERLPVQPINGEFAVRPDGTISLGVWGPVRVVGLTAEKAAAEVRRKLAAFTQVNGTNSRTENLIVTVELKANNSKAYYVILDSGSGEQITRLAYTGRETVLDAVAAVPGLAAVADRRTIRVVRQGAAGVPHQVLPVDWTAIIQHGDTRTNYALKPGDRVYVTGGR